MLDTGYVEDLNFIATLQMWHYLDRRTIDSH